MAQLIKKQTDVFLSMCEDAKELGEYNDCTVKALAITTGVPYKKVHAALKSLGRRDGKGATIWQMRLACEAVGFKMVNIPTQNFLEKYPKSSKLKNITMSHPERFKKVWKDGKNYIFSTTSHVAAVVNGENHDWSIGRRFRVSNVYEVVPA
jgi:hypothetical protein